MEGCMRLYISRRTRVTGYGSMAEINNNNKNTVRRTRAKDVVEGKRRLVEVPYTASIADAVQVMAANDVVAVAVAAPPGKWTGAGGSMILACLKTSGALSKHYIGMLSMLDILVHIAESDDMSLSVSSIIGHSLEGLSLWVMNPNTSVLEVMEPFSKGIHRALVPLESCTDRGSIVELKETSPGYHMLTQMDIIQFLKLSSNELKPFISLSVGQSGAVQKHVFAVAANVTVASAVKCMRNASLNAVAIVEGSVDPEQGSMLITGQGRKLVGTFSASDLRGCSLSALQLWLSLSVLEFTEKLSKGEKLEHNLAASASAASLGGKSRGTRPLVTCLLTATLEEVISKAVDFHVHRVWVIDEDGSLIGLVALTDILRAVHSVIAAQAAS